MKALIPIVAILAQTTLWQSADAAEVRYLPNYSGGDFRFDSLKHSAIILATSELAGLGSRPSTIEYIGRLAPEGSSPFVLIGGASSNWDPAEPYGLLVVEKRVISPMATRKEGPSAVMCISRSGEPRLISADDYSRSEDLCIWAIQAPIIPKPEVERLTSYVLACQRVNGITFYAFNSVNTWQAKLFRDDPCLLLVNIGGRQGRGGMVTVKPNGRNVYGSESEPVAAVILIADREKGVRFSSEPRR